jgi:hypothetical protein
MSINSMAQYNGGTSWTRHTDYFLKENGYDTTGTSMATSGASGYAGTGAQGVTLISNRHVLMANHVSALWGTTIISASINIAAQYPITVYFVNNNNTVFTYTINSAANVATIGSSSGPGYTDISIGYLNTTIDASLSFHKVIPSNFLSYIQNYIIAGNQKTAPYLPVFYMDSGDGASTNKRTWCGNLQLICNTCFSKILYYTRPRSGNRYNNSQAIVGGDSGNIIFIPVNNEIVILGTWYDDADGSPGNPGDDLGSSSFIAPNIDAMNAAMTSLAGTSYSLTQADLSQFNIF